MTTNIQQDKTVLEKGGKEENQHKINKNDTTNKPARQKDSEFGAPWNSQNSPTCNNLLQPSCSSY